MAGTADADLWHAYAQELTSWFPFSTEKSSGLRIYTVPLTSVGISIGTAIDQSIVNHDLFRIGDLLLPLESPVFLPGPSYSQRLLRYLQAAETPLGRQDAETIAKLSAADKQLADETDRFLTIRGNAFRQYQQDPVLPQLTFDVWTSQFYPPYELAQSRKNAAAQMAFQASQDYYGTQTGALWQDRALVSRAFSELSNPPYNMPTSTAQVTRAQAVGSGGPSLEADIKYEPSYRIDATFSERVNSWILTAKDPQNEPVKISFSSNSKSKHADAGWDDVGFSGVTFDHDEIVPRLPLFTAKFSGQPTDSHQASMARGVQDSANAVTVELQASDAMAFAISPDTSWDIPNVALKYPKLRSDASDDLYEPLVLVTHVLLGYQVSVTIQTDAALFSDIDAGLNKAKELGGTATIFGLDVGQTAKKSVVGFDQVTRNSSTRTIKIPPRDNAQLTLLGLMGRKLATPQRKST